MTLVEQLAERDAEIAALRKERDEVRMQYLATAGPLRRLAESILRERARADAAEAERDAARAEVEGLREALKKYVEERDPRNATENYDRIADAFYKETRLWPPGRSMPAAIGGQSPADEQRAWQEWRTFCDRWHEQRNDEARAALAADAALEPWAQPRPAECEVATRVVDDGPRGEVACGNPLPCAEHPTSKEKE